MLYIIIGVLSFIVIIVPLSIALFIKKVVKK